MRQRAVAWKRQTRWRATNYGCLCNTVPSEKNSITRVQHLPAAPGGALHSTTLQPPLCLDDFAPSVPESTCLHTLDHLLPVELLHCYQVPHWHRAWRVSCSVHHPICLLALSGVCLCTLAQAVRREPKACASNQFLFSDDMENPVVVSDQRT